MPEITQPLPACLESILQFDFKNLLMVEYLSGARHSSAPVVVVGPHTYRRAWIRLRGPIETFGIFFRPLAMWQLFQMPIALLVNQGFAGEAFLGNEVVTLWQRLAECVSFEDRVRVTEEYLLGRVANTLVRTAIASSALHILKFQGTPSVATLARHSGLSVRQFERGFREQIGMAPKLFARIARYQLALDSKLASPTRPWITIAHEFGYHDQVHMIKDFQKLSGSSPGTLLSQLGDMRPGCLDASSERSRVESCSYASRPRLRRRSVDRKRLRNPS